MNTDTSIKNLEKMKEEALKEIKKVSNSEEKSKQMKQKSKKKEKKQKRRKNYSSSTDSEILRDSSSESSKKRQKRKKDKKRRSRSQSDASEQSSYKERKRREREQERDREKQREKIREREREREKEREREREKERERQKEERLKEKERERERDRREKEKREREKEKERDYRDKKKERDRSVDNDKYEKNNKNKSRDEKKITKSPSSSRSSKKQGKFSTEIISNESNNSQPLNTFKGDIPVSNSDPEKIKRELYITNYPEELTPTLLSQLLNSAMIAINANTRSGDPIISVWMNTEKNYAILEFRTEEETNNAFKLDGITLVDKNIKLGRPLNSFEDPQQQLKDMFPTLTSFEKDINNPYLSRNISSGSTMGASCQYLSLPSTQTVLPTCSKLLVSNLPLNFDQSAVHKFLKNFGKIKTLEIIRDPITGQYSGQCHVEYEKEADTVKALHYIMGINLQGNILYIKRSSGLVPTYNFSHSGVNKSGSLGVIGTLSNKYGSGDDYMKSRENNPTNVICCKNMVTMKELEDDEEYEEITDDVWEECRNYGKVNSIKIPRPEGKGMIVSGIGKVFVEFATKDGAAFARDNLNGKSFRSRFVDVVFHPEDLYKRGQLD